MYTLKDVVTAFLTFKEWPIFTSPDPNLLCTKFSGENGTWNVFIQCHPEQPIMVVYSLFPISCPIDKQTDILLLIAKANDGLMIGNFEFVFEHSEIRFKTSLNATHMDMQLQICDAPFYYNLLSMDQYFSSFKSCIEE
jgi:hypothetical protein